MQVSKPYVYTFDRVLDHQSSQEDCMRELEPLAVSVLDGYHCCVMAYGQTGSGKVAPPLDGQMVFFGDPSLHHETYNSLT